MSAAEPTAEANLLKPARGTVPSPLRVSTMDELLWDAPADTRIVYTMYYRKADGTETSDSVQANFANQVWKSPALNDNANFTLKATLDGQDYFLTTSLTVNNPNVVVNTLTAGGDATFDGDVTATASGKSVRIRQLRGNGTVPLQISNSTVLDAGCDLTVGGALTSTGLATANGGLTVKSDKVLSAGEVTIANGKFLNGSGKDNHTDNAGVKGPAAFYRGYDSASRFKIAHR
ncbi:hypothetical protein ACFZB9_25335 [Kitasatospora sp. NPDC008050]|uniref:hypothetical protein n=1 Tax=Kitasatospora sp. NPDC008050 TaxID=3364021 RepID=UPI0036E365FA